MRWLSFVLMALLILLQYPLWIGKGGWLRVWDVDRQLQQQKEVNRQLEVRNAGLDAEKFRKITMKVLTMQLNSISIMDVIAYGGAALGVILATTQLRAGHVSLAGCLLIILLSADFFIPMRQRRNNEYFPDARFFTTVLTPYGEGFFCVRKMLGAIDQKYRPTFLANIAGIIEHRHKIANEIDVVVGEIFLGNEDLVISSIPAAGPVFIGPAHTKRHVVFGISEHFIKGTVENSLS